jgi:hypothetical protein
LHPARKQPGFLRCEVEQMVRRIRTNQRAVATAVTPVSTPETVQSSRVGRPKGSRNRLGEHFIATLCADFEAHGADVVARLREDDPAVYLRVVAQIVPQTVLMQEAKLDDLSDDELAAYLAAVRQALRIRDVSSDGELPAPAVDASR